jgi:hypothetical protein
MFYGEIFNWSKQKKSISFLYIRRTIKCHIQHGKYDDVLVAFWLIFSVPGAQTYSVILKRMSCSVLLPFPFSFRHRMQKRRYNSIIVLCFILLHIH